MIDANCHFGTMERDAAEKIIYMYMEPDYQKKRLSAIISPEYRTAMNWYGIWMAILRLPYRKADWSWMCPDLFMDV